MSQTMSQPRFATVQLSTGVRLQYAEHGKPGGEPLVCLHGYSDSSFSFSRIAPLLAERGYHVYALDQRGHGDSDRPLDGYAMDDYAADAAAFLDAVGIAAATLVGHSMGTFVARRVAALRPAQISKLALIGAGATGNNVVLRELREAIEPLTDPIPTDFVREFQESTVHVPVPAPFMDRVIAESEKLPARVWQSALTGLLAADDADRLGGITTPTLLLWGEQDGLFSADDQAQLLAALPDSRLITYPETGHTPHWERPELVVEHINAFLRDA